MTHKDRVARIDRTSRTVSVSRQTELLDISRASIYYQPTISKEDIKIMHSIDELFTDWPVFGTRRMRTHLWDYGYHIGRNRARRLMRIMGIEAIYPRKHICTSIPGKQHKKYPYLLRGITIDKPNHVWGTDITYVRLENSFCYLCVVMDWFSRYVVAWELSPSLESSFCINTLNRALVVAQPDIHNSDQGTQYTSEDYTGILEAHNIRISMDGRGRYLDNIFTERLWRTVKREDIYLKGYRTIDEAKSGLDSFFPKYNTKRRHASLDDRTPASIYFGNDSETKLTLFGQTLRETILQNAPRETFRDEADVNYIPEPIIIT